ncbi:unnamed protein product [Plutella xylostella]|uniref:(diamondback moth) hypothetical protein n=1 Tax=Plutella xylostella TaxID=51655 RepID=A0A8S4G114_PLUXY|nr:unnamed protein product [Plutella xylostella]
MEAVPKMLMISFELKVSPETTHFGPKLKQYIAEAYREDPDNYGNELHQLEGLRSAAVRPATDASGLAALVRYFCQLRAMQSRFPMAKGQPASVNFVWKDLYANMNCTSADIRFEMACILYNIGALHTQLAASEPRTSGDSLKLACTHYQKAAWAFQYLMEHYPQPQGMDVSPDIVRLLQEICFAQGQECILEKSIQDTKKPSVIGAVANQVRAFYKNSLAILGPSTGTDNIHEIIGTKLYNYWHRHLSFRNSYIGCIVCLYQGMNAEEQQKMGERVAFYQLAVHKLGEARKLAKYIEPVKVTNEALTFTNDVVEGKRKAAKNENEFIYHEEVPDKDFLIDLKPVCLVKGIPINFNDPEVSGPDIFSRLIPMVAHEASSLYSEEKAKLLRQVVNQAESKNTEIMEFMSSLQLDQLDVLDAEQRIPQEIVDRCAAMNAKTEIIQSLVDSMNNLAEIISDVENTLSECKTMIQEEAAKEKEYQKVIGPRPPSIVQTELSREFNKYQEAHSRTNESNQVLHKAMTLHIANLRLLAQPLDELEAKIPSIDNIEGLDRETMLEMRRVVSKAKEMQSQRSTLIQQLREDLNADDITGTLLAQSTPHTQLFQQAIEKHTDKVKIIEQNFAAQENIINRLTSLYASYGESRRLLSEVLRKREGLINALITSYDTYEELLAKCHKGIEFYTRLSHSATALAARLRGTCQVQAEERAQGTASLASSAKSADVGRDAASVGDPSATPKLTLKDYLPYMKSRGYARNVTPPGQPEVPSDTYYPESIYPTSVRPAPLGSEAPTEAPQMKYPDGYVVPQNTNPYNPYANQYQPSESSYAVPNSYSYPAKSVAEVPKIEVDGYGYNTPYTPSQYSAQMSNPQATYNPYYTNMNAQESNTACTDSQNASYQSGNVSQTNVVPNTSQYGYDPYGVPTATVQAHAPSIPEVPSVPYAQQTDLAMNFANMQVSMPKQEPNPYNTEYANTFYNVNYPQVNTPNMATYTNPQPNSATTLVTSQVPSEYGATNYPYGTLDQTVPENKTFNQQGVNPGTSTAYQSNPVDPAYSYSSTSEYDPNTASYPVYTNADNASMYTSTSSISSVVPTNLPPEYTVPDSAALGQLEAYDRPIKSHTTGQALTSNYYQPTVPQYDTTSVANYTDANVPQSVPNDPNSQYNTQVSANYTQMYQNHPGYTHNASTGNFEYNYGSQSSFVSYNNSVQGNIDPQTGQDPNWAVQGVYTSAGTHETVQSPSGEPLQMPAQQPNNQIYYNNPYGYQTMQPNEVVPNSQTVNTNYGANMNQSTYMQSGQGVDSSVTYSNNQVSSPTQNVSQAPNFNQNQSAEQTSTQSYQGIQNYQNVPDNSQTPGNYQSPTDNYQSPSQNYQNPLENYHPSTSHYQTPGNNENTPTNYQVPESNNQKQSYYENQPGPPQNPTSNHQEPPITPKSEEKPTPAEKPVPEESVSKTSTLDLLSDIDFSVEYKPLMPEIKVPQISENAIKKAVVTPKFENIPKPVKKEEVIERPAKMDLFSDPSLLNKFTEDVKSLQKLVDSLSSKVGGGLSLLESKWKSFQDVQTKENMSRSKRAAIEHTQGNIVTEVVPYDDSRHKLKSNSHAYINASYYKQLASWCIPLVISKCPDESDVNIFWKAVLENKITCVVCLLTEIEMQGHSYWPAKGQALELPGDVRVTLDEATCSVHWTERKLTVSSGGSAVGVTHFQINVFPSKIVCSPLVLLTDKVLSLTYEGRLSNQLSPCWIHCSSGGGRSALAALLCMLVCQVRAGQMNLCDMIEAGCAHLYRHRTNVLEDPKYLADAYRTALFYVHGVLCSGTTSFNGEAVSVPSGASILSMVSSTTKEEKKESKLKFSRESFEEMKQAPGLTSGDMKDPLNFLDPLWSLKKNEEGRKPRLGGRGLPRPASRQGSLEPPRSAAARVSTPLAPAFTHAPHRLPYKYSLSNNKVPQKNNL